VWAKKEARSVFMQFCLFSFSSSNRFFISSQIRVRDFLFENHAFPTHRRHRANYAALTAVPALSVSAAIFTLNTLRKSDSLFAAQVGPPRFLADS
jgi:hypothetical protein